MHHTANSARHLAIAIATARLRTEDAALNREYGRLLDKAGHAFGERVALWIKNDERFLVQSSFQPKGLRGDIDVLVAVPHQRRFVALECKAYAPSRLPSEWRNTLDSFALKSKSDVSQFQEKVDWLEANRSLLVRSFALPNAARDWPIEGIFVLQNEILPTHLAKIPFRVVPFYDLAHVLGVAKAPSSPEKGEL